MNDNEKLDELLHNLVVFETSIQSLINSSIEHNRNIYVSTFFILGVAKRAISQSSGFRALVNNRNAICAIPMVRLQLDTAIRLNAAQLYSNSEEFCLSVWEGKKISKLKSQDGSPMTDKYLCEALARDYPWVSEVYTRTSGFIHFSERHIFSAISEVTEGRTVSWILSPDDTHLPAKHFHEMVLAFIEASKIIIKLLHIWLSEQINHSCVNTSNKP